MSCLHTPGYSDLACFALRWCIIELLQPFIWAEADLAVAVTLCKNVFPYLFANSMLRDLISSSYLKDMLLYKVVLFALIEQGSNKITYEKHI